jgi:hypothetical protein
LPSCPSSTGQQHQQQHKQQQETAGAGGIMGCFFSKEEAYHSNDYAALQNQVRQLQQQLNAAYQGTGYAPPVVHQVRSAANWRQNQTQPDVNLLSVCEEYCREVLCC